MIPLTRQTLCLRSTICESWGCNDLSSSLTDSLLALCSMDNWIAVTPLAPFSALPNTTRESPALATYSSPLQITPTKQHDPTDAICGFSNHCCLTSDKNSSSVVKKAFLMTSADISWCSVANSANEMTNVSRKDLLALILLHKHELKTFQNMKQVKMTFRG